MIWDATSSTKNRLAVKLKDAMRPYIWILVLLTLGLTACNLGVNQDTPQPIATSTESVAPTLKPVVSIVSPNNGDTFPVNQPILVSVSATDSVGVTRIQLFANGSIAKTVSSASNAGDKVFSAVLDYTPRTTGEVTLRVLAYRGVTASDPVDVAVTVQSQASTQPTTIPLPGGGGSSGTSGTLPTIPNDGVCRVLTNVGLNFRSAPNTTTGNILLTLNAGTLAPVTARLSDNTWYKITYNGQTGWVSGNTQYVTLTGNCFNVPIESTATATPTVTPTLSVTNTPTRTPTPTNTSIPQRPDLIVTNITGDTTIALAGGASITRSYSVTITNVGLGASGQFSATISVNNGTPLDLGAVGGLEAGQSVVLMRDLTFTSAGTYALRVDADPANQVLEVSEVNNRGDISVTVNN